MTLLCVVAQEDEDFIQPKDADYTRKKDHKDSYKIKDIDYQLINISNDEDDFYFIFNNIGIEDRYYDPHLLEEIDRATAKGNDNETINLLQMYIAHFGIRNFSEDIDLIWKLAQLYERNEMFKEAKAAYRLVLKHYPIIKYEHVRDFTNAKVAYDDMTELERDLYVPLDHYYKLVDFRSQIDTLKPPKSVLTNMGEEINARETPDYGPSISSGNDMILFTRKIYTNTRKDTKLNDNYSENLFISRGEDGFWEEAEELPAPIKSSCNEGSATISKDGKFLVFSRCQVAGCQFDCYDCMGGCDLFYSEYDVKKETWSQPVNFGPGVNSIGWDSQPSFSITEDTIFFASNRFGGFGMSDIYFIYKVSKGKWSKAMNMGPIINTRGNEWSPFHSKTNKVFYFSSNAQIVNFDPKRISNDLYKCNYNRTHNHWSEPKNLGPLVNGEGDETYFSIDVNNKYLYYARTEENATNKEVTDIFSFPVPMGAQPTATTVLKGTLLDEETGKPYKGIVSVIDLENGIEVAPKFMRPDGSYEFDLINHNKYLLIIQGDDFFRIEELFKLNGDTTIESTAKSIAAQKTLQFTSIIFENGKADILAEMHKDLDNIVDFMVDNPEFDLHIGGHTDTEGNQDANKKLSQRRADAIKKYLEDKGYIDDSRIEAIGFGSTKPIRMPELTEEDKSINRRVEFEIKRVER